jgi:hypothetical protein
MTADGYLDGEALTQFDGIPFDADHPYSYREAKRVLRLAMEELRRRKDLKRIGMSPEAPGRPAITGLTGNSVWDFLRLKGAPRNADFTSTPHFTLSIQASRFVVIVVLPNAVPAAMRARLTARGPDSFRELVELVSRRVVRAVRGVERACPYIELVQRHFKSQRSAGIEDARLEFDLRTASERDSKIKHQPEWLDATYQALSRKRSNLQIAIGAVIRYGSPQLRSRRVLDVIAGVWVACDPWLRRIMRDE